MGRNITLGELLLAVEGGALLRQLLIAPQPLVDARVAGLRSLLERIEEPPLSLGVAVDELGPVEGYALWSKVYDTMPNPLIAKEQPVVRGLIDELAPGRALDAACGTGRHTSYLIACGHDVIGIDQSPEMLVLAAQAAPGADLREGALEALPVDDASVDVAVCSLALTHLRRLDPGIAELGRVVRPGGRVVLSDIHPAVVLFTGQAFFPIDATRSAFVRNHVQLHGAYLSAFAAAGLTVRRCLEPVIEEADLPTLGLSARFAPEATAGLFVGLPQALIWDLERR